MPDHEPMLAPENRPERPCEWCGGNGEFRVMGAWSCRWCHAPRAGLPSRCTRNTEKPTENRRRAPFRCGNLTVWKV